MQISMSRTLHCCIVLTLRSQSEASAISIKPSVLSVIVVYLQTMYFNLDVK